MALDLSMIGLTVQDLAASREFYRRLGVDVPADERGVGHVQVQMATPPTFFLNTQMREDVGGSRTILEFYLPSPAAVDAKHDELVAFGYRSHRAPYDTSFGMRFALIDDPDGNVVLLSAPLAHR